MSWRDNHLSATSGVKLMADDGTTPFGGHKLASELVFKVSGATAGHLAVLTSDGGIGDGGVVPSGLSLPVATTTVLGGVKPDGTTITTANDGTMTVASIAVLALTDISTVGGPALSDVDVINRAGVDYKGTFSARVALIRKTPAGSRTITLTTGSTTATLTASDHDKTVVVTGVAGTLTVDGTITDGFRAHVINHTGPALTYSGITGLAGSTSLANNSGTTVSLANSTTEATASAAGGSTSASGSDGQIQINNGGAFGAAAIGAGLTLTGSGASRTLSASGGSATLYSRPALSSFTTLNGGSGGTATVITEVAGRGITIRAPAATSTNITGIYKSAPSAPFMVTLTADYIGLQSNYYASGMVLYSGGDLLTFGISGNGDTNVAVHQQIGLTRWNNTGSFNSGTFTADYFFSGLMRLRFHHDGTNYNFYISPDGDLWLKVGTVAASSTVVVNNIGIYVNPQDATTSNLPMGITMRGWELVTSSIDPLSSSVLAGV